MKLCPLAAIAMIGAVLAVPVAAGTVVPLPRFEAVSLEGKGRVILRHGDRQAVTIVEGDPDVTRFEVDRNSLKISACQNRCPANYRLVIEVVSPNVDAIAVTGGGTVAAAGPFPSRNALALSVQGGGLIDTQAVSARRVAASVNGGGEIRTRADASLAASVNGGGTITYAGAPSVATAIRGGGKVRRAGETAAGL